MESPPDPAAAPDALTATPRAQAILAALAASPARSLAPVDLARAIAASGGPAADWHALLAPVRQTALALARAGKLVVLRKGRPVAADAARGVIRLALPERAVSLAPARPAPPSSAASS